MKVLYGAGIVDARGSLAGMTASRNTYGAYVRSKVTPINKNTNAQQGVRQDLATMSQSWAGITDAQRLAWNEIAPNWSKTGIFGNSQQFTGFNLYGRLNRYLQTIGQALIEDPILPGEVTGFTSASVVADTTAGTMVLTLNAATPAAQSTIVEATAALSAGKTFAGTAFRKISTLTNGDGATPDLEAAYINKFGALPPVGSRVFVRVRPVVNATGQPGTTLQASDIAV